LLPTIGVERSEPWIILSIRVVDALDNEPQPAVGEGEVEGA
jgi:hypothetical protein